MLFKIIYFYQENHVELDLFLIEKIVAIIKRHDSGNIANSLEEKLVRDADKLWRYSKIGFWIEKKRQGLNANELYNHLAKYDRSWFFTPTALMQSQKELTQRLKEIEDQTNKT